ncbi:MAG: SDR family NAD(P)-dependent oxidoreductase [Acidimicrobiia bacterium]
MHVVTGASDGIGRAVAAELADRGARVLAVSRDGARLDRLSQGRPALSAVAADLATSEGRANLYRQVPRDEEIESVVHGAGSRVPVQPFDVIDPDGLVEDFRIHVAAVVAVTQHFASRARRVVVFDSYSATVPRAGWAGYSIVKAAAHMVARAAAAEMEGPEVLRLYPGAVRTPLLDAILHSAPSPAREVYRSMDAAGRVAEPEEIGAWVADILLAAPGGATVRHYDHEHRPGPNSGTGACLCGGVKYRIDGAMRDVIECHCERCRRTSGHHVAATAARVDDIELAQSETLAWFTPADDPGVRYGFCRRCGSSLFWAADGSDNWSVSAGTLDQPSGLRTSATLFADEAADYLSLDPTIPTFGREP